MNRVGQNTLMFPAARTARHRAISGWLVLLGLWATFAGDAWAGGGGVTRFAYGNPNRGSGLSVEIDNRWILGDGYRPVRVTVRPIGKANFQRDRQVTVALNHDTQFREFPKEITTRVIDLPEGAAQVVETIYARQNRIQSKMGIEFWEGRRELRNVHAAPLNEQSGNAVWNDGVPGLLIIDFDVPRRNEATIVAGGEDTADAEDRLATQVPSPEIVRGIRPIWPAAVPMPKKLTWNQVQSGVPTLQYLSPYDLPREWIGLSAVDICYLGLDDLIRLRSQLPDRWSVIECWLRNGGMLWVAGVGDEFARIGDADAALGFTSVTGREVAAEAGDTYANSQAPAGSPSEWNFVTRGRITDSLNEFDQQEGYQWINGQYTQVIRKDNEDGWPEEITADSVLFATRDLQLGKVVLWQSQDPLSEPGNAYWSVAFKRLGTDRWTWSGRHGFSLVRDNPSFWNFLIPGVGLAPVNLFRVVITLFVLLIGPINYSILKRWKRLNWILFTVPISAVLVTFALTNYALVTDGISVRARLRSVTHVDQRAAHATTWSRQAYYAGIAPSGGLVFPADVAVYAVDYDPISRFDGRGHTRNVVWGENQRLASGFLPSRTTAQFMVQRSRGSSMGLALRKGDDGVMACKNRLRGHIEQLLVMDADRNAFVGRDIAEETDATLGSATSAEVTTWLNDYVLSRYPRVPPGVEPEAAADRSSGRRWNYANANNHLSEATDGTSRLEASLRRLSTAGCPPLSYVAVVRDCAEVPIGVRSARQSESLHVVIGEW